MPRPVQGDEQPATPARPHARPTTPPPPAPDPLAGWPTPLLFCADAGEAATVASRAADSGFRGIGLQLSTFTTSDVHACQAHGLVVVGWGIAAPSDASALEACGARAYCPQIEGPGQRDLAIQTFTNRIGSNMPRGIVTTFSGLEDPAEAGRVVWYIGVTWVECYVQDGSVHADLDRMTWQARQYGLPRPLPVVGLYDDIGAESYPALARYAPAFGVWRGLQMPERAWAQVRALVA